MIQTCKKIFQTMLLVFLSCVTATASADGGKIIFIPHDNRPISLNQPVEVVEQTGTEIFLPPQELLGSHYEFGQPDELWNWLAEYAPAARAIVVSSDVLIYGGLVPSRKHELPQEIISARVENFEKLRKENPSLKIYVFASMMRNPYKGTKGHSEEPQYYETYGESFAQYTRLVDKSETSKLNKREQSYLESLRESIPQEFFDDWFARRRKNLDATKRLAELTELGVIDYLAVGRDDNSPLGQTHRENRELLAFAKEKDLPKTKFQSLCGIDEFSLLLLTRAVNDMRGEFPFVNVQYNKGKGGETLPAYSDDIISKSIDSAVMIAGGLTVPDPKRADFVLLVNTDIKGRTFHTHNTYPDGKDFSPLLKANDGTKFFADMVEKFVEENYPVGVADITFANGSDNALMKLLKEKNLLFNLRTYAGWNTATNSTGFALSTGMLAQFMSPASREKLLARRYLDDWAYQANVRTIVGNELVKNFGDAEKYYHLDDELSFAEERNTELMHDFAEKNLPHFDFLRDFKVKNTWNRMFECDIIFSEK